MVRAGGDWGLEFWSKRWNFGSIDGVVQEFCTLVVCLKNVLLHICEVGMVDFGYW